MAPSPPGARRATMQPAFSPMRVVTVDDRFYPMPTLHVSHPLHLSTPSYRDRIVSSHYSTSGSTTAPTRYNASRPSGSHAFSPGRISTSCSPPLAFHSPPCDLPATGTALPHLPPSVCVHEPCTVHTIRRRSDRLFCHTMLSCMPPGNYQYKRSAHHALPCPCPCLTYP